MKELYISGLQKNQNCDSLFLGIVSFVEAKDKNNNTYVDLEFVDMSGTIKGKIWSEKLQRIERATLTPGAIVKVVGNINEFRGSLQLNVYEMYLAQEHEYDIQDFRQVSKKDIEIMWSEINERINSITDEEYKSACLKLIENYGEQIKYAPAAERLHHAFIGGLIEHLLEMFGLMDKVKEIYPELNYSLLTAGILFHDIGKIEELQVDKFSIIRTDKGKLIGHISIGAQMLKECSATMTEEKYMLLQHMILSHHGFLEFGSPVVPKTTEAAVLHHLDKLSSDIRQFERVKEENLNSNSTFSSKDWALNTEVYLK